LEPRAARSAPSHFRRKSVALAFEMCARRLFSLSLLQVLSTKAIDQSAALRRRKFRQRER
jgi:hypothetical protein